MKGLISGQGGEVVNSSLQGGEVIPGRVLVRYGRVATRQAATVLVLVQFCTIGEVSRYILQVPVGTYR